MFLKLIAVWLVAAILFLAGWHRMFKYCEIDLSEDEIKRIESALEGEK